MSPKKKPSLEFLASLKAVHAAKSQEIQRLKKHLEALQAKLTADARLIDQVEDFIKTEDFALSDMAAEVTAVISNKKHDDYPNPTNGSSVQPSPRSNGRKSRRRPPESSESERIRAIAADVLKEAGHVLSGPQILSGITATGYRFASKNPVELLKKALKDAPLITRRGRGYWLTDVDLPNDRGPERSRPPNRTA